MSNKAQATSIVLMLVLLFSCRIMAKDLVDVGMGSYLSNAPKDIKLPPEVIYKTGNLTGPVPTTDWCSSLLWQQYSSNHFAHPLAMCTKEEGLAISYPGQVIHAVKKHVFASFQKELVLCHSNVDKFPDARMDGFSDWFVDVLFTEGSNTMRLSYGHGSPFIYARYNNGNPKIRFESKVTIWSGSSNSSVLGITHKGSHWGLFGAADSSWSGLDGKVFINQSKGKDYFSLAILPDNNPKTLKVFEEFAYTHITNTEVNWRYISDKGIVETDFIINSKNFQGSNKETIFALYPHQWQNMTTTLLPYTYNSIRGPMKLTTGRQFRTQMLFPGVLPYLPGTSGCNPKILSAYLAKSVSHKISNPGDTYWGGKQLGQISNLIPLAQQAGNVEWADHFTKMLKDRLEEWFTAPENGNKKEHYFFYENNWNSLIGIRPSYGSSDQLNDHHFHYGYFIRGAAEIARTDRNWAKSNRWGKMVNLLIRDIACPDRNDMQFPFLRCFDPYAGHSWASGHAKFGDGNNQESSSESMNAWTGIILWGLASDNEKLRDLGIYLYTTEMNAINAYWFDVNDNLFPKGYTQQSAALIWGGKTDFATWFSGEPEHIVGINLLPIQSGSLYLGLYPDYVKRNLEGMAKLRGSYNWIDWYETLWMYEALADPDSAMNRFKSSEKSKDPLTQAFAYYWIANLQTLGQINRSITSDCPTAVVFTDNGNNTYTAYNMTTKAITVNFSDGMKIDLKPGQNTYPHLR